MRITILFGQIGNYHLARLRAANSALQSQGWRLTAIQYTDKTSEHPWGELATPEPFEIETLLPTATHPDAHPDSPAAASAIVPCLGTLKPDVVIIPGWGFPVARAALSWCQQNAVPAVLMSESKYDDEPRTWWKEQLKSWLYVRQFASAIVGCEAHKDYLIRLGMEGDRIFYGYNAVDNDYFAAQAELARTTPLAARQQISNNMPQQPFFLAVTRLMPRKNIARLVEAFAAYREQLADPTAAWSLVICGSGSEQSAIEKLVEQHNLTGCVHLPGFLTYQQIGAWYGLASAFVHPALVEQWGLVINEACAAGLPILCSETVGACPSLVSDECNGFTFDPEDTAAMTQVLLKVHRLDEGDRAQMGAASQQMVSQFAPAQFGEGILRAVQVACGLETKTLLEIS